MTYNDIIAKIADILKTITSIQEVFEVVPQEPKKYPYACVYPVGHQDTYLTLQDVQRDYTFKILIVGNMETTRETTQTAIRGIADQVMNALALQTNVKVGGTVDYSRLTNASFSFDTTESAKYIAEITFTCRGRFARY